MDCSLSYYKITPFITHNLPEDDLVLQLNTGIVVITDRKLIRLIPFLENRVGQKITKSELTDLFGEDVNSYINFLIENKIIKSITLPNFNIKEIHFISNSKNVSELVSRSFESITGFFKSHNDISSFSNLVNANPNNLFYIFLNPYDKELSYKLTNLFSNNNNTLSIMSYIYNGRFYIESIYSAKWKTPCHICQFNHIQSEHRFGAAHGVTYQQIIDHLFQKDKSFQVATPLDFGDEMNISSQIFNRLNVLLGINDEVIDIEEFNKGVVMDINSKHIQTDNTHHWELCDCYE